MADGIARAMMQMTAKRQDIQTAALRRIEATQALYDEGFSALDTFDVDAFMSDLLLAANYDSLIMLPKQGMPGEFGVVAAVEYDAVVVGNETQYEAQVPLESQPPDAQKLIQMMEAMFYRSRVPEAFPVLDFRYYSYNRPSTVNSTNELYDAVTRAGYTFYNPEVSAATYLEERGIVYYVSPGTKPTSVSREWTTKCSAKLFIGYATPERLKEFGANAMGLMFNPFHVSSQSRMTRMERHDQHYEFEYENNYKYFKSTYARYPYFEPGIRVYTLDMWTSYLNLKIRDVHPRWYCYDMILNYEPLPFKRKKYVSISPEFVNPIVVERDGVAAALELDNDRALPATWSRVLLQSRVTEDLIKMVKARVEMTRLEVLFKTSTELCVRILGQLVKYKIYQDVPVVGKGKDPWIYHHDGSYYEVKQVKDGKEMIYSDKPYYRCLVNSESSYFEDFTVLDVRYASQAVRPDEWMSPSLRDYLMDATIMKLDPLCYEKVDVDWKVPKESDEVALELLDYIG